MESVTSLFSSAAAMPLIFAVVLLAILIVSFRSRAVVFCQYLEAMTGIELEPSDVRRVYAERGRNGVREMFLDLIIREDLKEGPIEIPEEVPAAHMKRAASRVNPARTSATAPPTPPRHRGRRTRQSSCRWRARREAR